MKVSIFLLLAALFAGAPTISKACEEHGHAAKTSHKGKKASKAAKAKKAASNRVPASRNCAQFARCRASWCGEEAVKRCERGESPNPLANAEKELETKCRHWLTCEGMNCGQAAYDRCMNGEDPNGGAEEEDDEDRPQPR